jgi:cytochrome c
MPRTWVIAGIALAASTGPTLGQDAAAGEQVFKRLCSPCHEIGPDAKIKLGPPLNGDLWAYLKQFGADGAKK